MIDITAVAVPLMMRLGGAEYNALARTSSAFAAIARRLDRMKQRQLLIENVIARMHDGIFYLFEYTSWRHRPSVLHGAFRLKIEDKEGKITADGRYRNGALHGIISISGFRPTTTIWLHYKRGVSVCHCNPPPHSGLLASFGRYIFEFWPSFTCVEFRTMHCVTCAAQHFYVCAGCQCCLICCRCPTQ